MKFIIREIPDGLLLMSGNNFSLIDFKAALTESNLQDLTYMVVFVPLVLIKLF